MEEETKWVVARDKVLDYLLSESHPGGKGKAAFFQAMGFTRGEWEKLARELVDSARNGETTQQVATHFGSKLVILGKMSTPSGKQIVVRTVWMELPEANAWRLVTAYPVRSEHDR